MNNHKFALTCFSFLFCFMLVSGNLHNASADEYDFTSTKAAISKLKLLPGSVQKVQQVVKKMNLGPFPMSGSCDYNYAWYCLGMACNTFKWSWKPDFSWLKKNLEAIYNNINTASSSFDTYFSPLKNWLVTTLPAFSEQFDIVSARILQAEAVINAPGSQPAAIASAKLEIQQALDELVNKLNADSQQLNVSIRSLANFNNRLDAALSGVVGAQNSLNNTIARNKNQLNRDVSSWPCGAGAIKGRFNGVASSMSSQFQNVTTTAQSYGVMSNQSNKEISLILGTIINIKNNYQNVQQNLKAAKIAPAGAVQELRLNVAGAAWRDLAAYARTQL